MFAAARWRRRPVDEPQDGDDGGKAGAARGPEQEQEQCVEVVAVEKAVQENIKWRKWLTAVRSGRLVARFGGQDKSRSDPAECTPDPRREAAPS